MTNDAPCKDCKDRHPACHDTCERYKAFKQPFLDATEKRLQAGEVSDYYHSRRTKAIRARRDK